MYIKKSVLSGIIIAAGVCVLSVLASFFCFAETKIPDSVFCAAWMSCLLAVNFWVNKICGSHR